MKFNYFALFAGLTLGGILLLGVPTFLRTPVWVDVTYHDVSAWNILHGGVHYRDVFETNLPGMVWVHAILRPIIGWSHEAIRCADLVMFGLIVFLLTRFAKKTCLSATSQIWLAVPCVLFYVFETEFIHVQRDGWMLLPATMAAWLRFRQLGNPSTKLALVEGFVWGLAVWIKPHAVVPAFFVWLVCFMRVPAREMGRATLRIVGGGLIAGMLGVAWLLATGTWKPMWDVLLNWNGEYYDWSPSYIYYKAGIIFGYFRPFSQIHYVALPLALIAIFRRKPELAARSLLAALYLGWLLQAAIIQKEFDYAHSPPTILALAFVACHRWLPVGPVFLLWSLFGSVIFNYAAKNEKVIQFEKDHPALYRKFCPPHSSLDPARLKLWSRCWHDGSMELKDELTFFYNIHCCPDWADLERVADFLRENKVGDRDLICWHDSTHPLYIWLNVRPGLRYPHVMTAMKFRSKLGVIRSETLGSPAKYVVADLVPCSYLEEPFPKAPPPGLIEKLPPYFPDWGKLVYPWNQKPVYRAGRYFVFEITHPEGDIVFPLPDAFKN